MGILFVIIVSIMLVEVHTVYAGQEMITVIMR